MMKAYGYSSVIEIKQTQKTGQKKILRERGWGPTNERGKTKAKLKWAALSCSNN
jgi:hypothetical protein